MTVISINILGKSPSILLSFGISAESPNLALSCESLTIIHSPIKFLLWLFLFVAKLCLGRFAPESRCTSRPTNTVSLPSGLAYTEMVTLLLFSKLMVWHHCSQQKSSKTMNECWECNRDVQLILKYLLALKGLSQNIFLAQNILLTILIKKMGTCLQSTDHSQESSLGEIEFFLSPLT